MSSFKVEFPADAKRIAVVAGMTALEAAAAAGLEIAADCAGRGTCGKCKARISGDISKPTEAEKKHLSVAELAEGMRLACLTKILGATEIVFSVPVISSEILPFRMDYDPDPRLICDPPSIAISGGSEDGQAKLFGAAVDVGTTSLNARLADLRTGRVLSSVVAANPQRLYGADVASRINFIIENKNGLEILRSLVAGRVNEMIGKLAAEQGGSAEDVRGITLVGNPTMAHALLGIDPRAIAESPYVPPTTQAMIFDANEAGLKAAAGARLFVLPAAAAYVGADALSASLRARLNEPGGPRLLIDLGTNAEIMLSNGDDIFCCAAAAGPALEGAHIRYGMSATDGAIDRVDFRPEEELTTVNNEPAAGLCGTGLLDAISGLLSLGIILPGGRIVAEAPSELPESVRSRVREGAGGREFVLARKGERGAARDIALTQQDIREVQLAVGAIRAGIDLLLERAGVPGGEIETIYVAGALGTYLRSETALRVGIVPPIAPERVRFVGNAALDGATEALLSGRHWDEARSLGDSVMYIELSAEPSFQARFAERMTFPAG
ncbi:MAG: ASKHA domain-containing protein [bacterium]